MFFKLRSCNFLFLTSFFYCKQLAKQVNKYDEQLAGTQRARGCCGSVTKSQHPWTVCRAYVATPNAEPMSVECAPNKSRGTTPASSPFQSFPSIENPAYACGVDYWTKLLYFKQIHSVFRRRRINEMLEPVMFIPLHQMYEAHLDLLPGLDNENCRSLLLIVSAQVWVVLYQPHIAVVFGGFSVSIQRKILCAATHIWEGCGTASAGRL